MLADNHQSVIRIFDIILIAFFLLASLIPVGVFAWQQSQIPEDVALVAVIIINGNEVDRFRLYEDAQMLITYTAEDGLTGNQYNIVEIDGSRIRVQEDNSPDQIGVFMGWISRPGQTIIVLPHRFLIRIELEHPESYEEDIIIPFG
jgi:hypothetical protein